MEGLWWHIRLRVVSGATLIEIALGTLPCNVSSRWSSRYNSVSRTGRGDDRLSPSMSQSRIHWNIVARFVIASTTLIISFVHCTGHVPSLLPSIF